jgi:hypothetical protein
MTISTTPLELVEFPGGDLPKKWDSFFIVAR